MDTCPDCGTLVYGGERSCQVCGTALSDVDDERMRDGSTDASSEGSTDGEYEWVDPMGIVATSVWGALWVVTTPALFVLTVVAGAWTFFANQVAPGPPAIIATVVLAMVPTAVTLRYVTIWATEERETESRAEDWRILSAAVRRLPALVIAAGLCVGVAWVVWFVTAFVLFPPFGTIIGFLLVGYFLIQLSLGFAAIVIGGDDPFRGLFSGYLLSDGVELTLLGLFVVFAGGSVALRFLAGGSTVVGFGRTVVTMLLITMLAASLGRIYLEQRTAREADAKIRERRRSS